MTEHIFLLLLFFPLYLEPYAEIYLVGKIFYMAFLIIFQSQSHYEEKGWELIVFYCEIVNML